MVGGMPMTMSSLEIAERTGKDHRNVLRDIRIMLEGLSIAEPKFGSSYQDGTGRTLPCFNLPKRECLILVAGYSIPLRAKITSWGIIRKMLSELGSNRLSFQPVTSTRRGVCSDLSIPTVTLRTNTIRQPAPARP